MNKILTLIKITTKDSFARYMQQLNVKGKISGKIIALIPLLALLPIVTITGLIYDSFSRIGMGHLALAYSSIAAVILMVVSSIPLILSSLFYSKDLSLLATLPIRGRSIIVAKLTGIYPYLLIIGGAFYGSASIFYLNDIGYQIRPLILSILMLITLPIIPIVIGSLITMPFMSLVAGRKYRNLFAVVGNILLLGIILAFQILLSKTANNMDAIIELLTQEDGLLRLIGSGYPPSIWMTKAVVSSNLDLLWYILLHIAGIAVLIFIASFVYDQALKKYNQQQSINDSKAITYKKSGIKMLLLKRNLGIIFTNPTFLLNTIMTIFIPVIIFVIYSFMGIVNLDTLSSTFLLPYREYIYLGIVISPSIIGNLSATSINREGKFFWETRVMPIRHEDSLASREMTTLLLNGIGQLIVAVAAYIIIPIDPLKLFNILIVVVFLTMLFSKIDMIINISLPYLNWSNPTACIKNNMDVMISLASRVVIGLFIYIIYYLFNKMGPSYVIAFIGLMSLILYLIAYFLIKKVYLKKYSEIDAI